MWKMFNKLSTVVQIAIVVAVMAILLLVALYPAAGTSLIGFLVAVSTLISPLAFKEPEISKKLEASKKPENEDIC